MKILFVLECWHTGGTEAHVGQLGRYLNKNGLDQIHVAILGGWDDQEAERISEWTEKQYLIKQRGISALVRLNRIIQSLSPDICHLHLYSNLLPVSCLCKAARVKKLVTTLHMPLTHWNLRHRQMWRLAIRLADEVTGVSGEVLKSIGMEQSEKFPNAHVISPPCLMYQDKTSMRGKKKNDLFTVSACGRLAKEKDWPTLFRAFAEFQETADKPVRLVHMGDGPLEQEMNALISELGITRCVEMRGKVTHRQVLGTVSRSDVFVLPSRFEGLGMAALEAMQCGVPTITSDFKASYDFIEDGVTGWRFQRGNSEDLKKRLLYCYSHRKQSEKTGKTGQKFVFGKYSEKNTFDKYVSIYMRNRDGGRHG